VLIVIENLGGGEGFGAGLVRGTVDAYYYGSIGYEGLMGDLP
jgi:hypothetical protein